MKIEKRFRKYISKKNWEQLKKVQPDSVSFDVKDGVYMICKVEKGKDLGRGLAICSVLDKFDPKIGVNKSLGRAIKALKTKQPSEPVRFFSLKTLPSSWTVKQAERVVTAPSWYKSEYLYIGSENA